jgi:hypothetical protein
LSQDNISTIFIDKNGRLCIKPATKEFTLIYRSATEVHWDNKERFLYSPKPRELTYLDWYKHIISVISIECDCKLTIITDTKWIGVPNDLKNDILDFDKINVA